MSKGEGSLEELQRFGERLAKDIRDSSSAMDLLASGLVLETDYSGLDTPAIVWRRLASHLDALGTKVSLELHRSCDVNGFCQEILCESAQAGHGSKHVFGDILGRLSLVWQCKLKKLEEQQAQHPESSIGEESADSAGHRHVHSADGAESAATGSALAVRAAKEAVEAEAVVRWPADVNADNVLSVAAGPAAEEIEESESVLAAEHAEALEQQWSLEPVEAVERLEQEHVEPVEAVVLAKKSDKVLKPKALPSENVYVHIGTVIEQNKTAMFSKSCKAQCLVHSRLCRVHAADVAGPDGRRRLRFHISGPSCTAWSSMGQRKGLLDQTSVAWHVWLNERKVLKEDVIIVENSPNLKPGLIAEALGETHTIVWANLSPEDVAWPARRPRLYLACVAKAALIWGGPEVDPGSKSANVRDDFMSMYGKTCELNGDCFLVDSDENRAAEIEARWSSRRGAACSAVAAEDLPMEDCLPCLPE